MKMKYCIVILTILLLLNACNRSYRIQNVNINSKNVEFILPPFSKLTKKEKGKYKINKKFRFHYISFNFQGNYIESLEDLDEFEYKISKESHLGRNRKQCDEKNSCQYNATNNSLQIEFDYQTLSNGEVINNFSTLPIDLLKKLATEEKNNSWSKSIAQNIVEKVFEILPVPQETVLARYGAILDNDKIFTLLSPKIQIVVDSAVLKTREQIPSWQFDMVSQFPVIFGRNLNGDLIQNQFISSLDKTHIPINGNKYFTHLASSSSIQLSRNLYEKKYIGLYKGEKNKKSINYDNEKGEKNKKSINYDNEKGDNACKNTQNDSIKCNSVLIISDSFSDLYKCVNDYENANCKNTQIATFGNRNIITPQFLMFINNMPFYITYNSKIYNLNNSFYISKKYKLFRAYNKKYYKVINQNIKTIVMPGDEIRGAK